MYTAKQAVLTKEHFPEVEVYIFFMDRRAYGKGYYNLYKRAEELGVRFIRGKPSRLVELKNHDLKLKYEDTIAGKTDEIIVNLAALATSLAPARDNQQLAEVFGISLDEDGFFDEPDPIFRPLETSIPGIYLCGFSRGPSDISESVAQASAASAKAVMAISREGS